MSKKSHYFLIGALSTQQDDANIGNSGPSGDSSDSTSLLEIVPSHPLSKELCSSIVKENAPMAVVAGPSGSSENLEIHGGNLFHNDPAKWIANDYFREYVALHGCTQNIKENDFVRSERTYPDGSKRFLSLSLFERKLQNGEKAPRTWLVYSESKGAVICAPCFLFGKRDDTSFSNNKEGFKDWKHANERVLEHESSFAHKQCVLDLKQRANVLGRIDHALVVQLEEEILYWRNVLKRVIAAVKCLASRGLPFRGNTEVFGEYDNGNFMMMMEFLSQFDPFMEEHIRKYGNKGSGSTSYLSKTTYEEIIEILAQKVTSTIMEELKTAKYYSIILDSTPDISHIDQLSFIIRYVKPFGTAVERFIILLDNTGHKGEDLYNIVISTLQFYEIEIQNMRGQSYDNAANMSGQYKGLQARIKEDNPLAEFTPCAAHSLNIVGTHAAESCFEAQEFFSVTVQNVYNFFSESPQRWKILQNFAESRKLHLKSLSTTRWSARADAVRVLVQFWPNIIQALKSYETSPTEKSIIKNRARGLRIRLERLESAIMASVWFVLLDRFNATSQKLQGVSTSMSDVLDLYESLIKLIEDTRSNFQLYEDRAKEISVNQQYERDIQRRGTRTRRSDETSEGEINFDGRAHFRINTFNVILNQLDSDLRERYIGYKNIYKKFEALMNFGTLDQEALREKARTLQTFYSSDLESPQFEDELYHFQRYCQEKKIEKNSPSQILEEIREKSLQIVFPNVDIAYRMFISTAVTNCSAERSFSCLKRVKNYLRSTQAQNRLNFLMTLAVEADLLSQINFDEVIQNFAEKKARKKSLI